MKCKVERAKPSNVLDVYSLFKEIVKEGTWSHPKLSDQLTREYYFHLLNELSNPAELIYIAQKGNSYLGYIHAHVVAQPLRLGLVCYLKVIHVREKKRKLGIGQKLLDKLIEDCQKIGITEIEFLCQDGLLGYWEKKGAKKLRNFMVLDLKGEK